MRLSPELEAKCLALAVSPAVRAPAPVTAFVDEAAFQGWLNEYARDHGWLVYHTRDSRRSEPGFPDTILLREQSPRTRLVVAELKMPGKKPTAAQRKWLRLFELAGAEVFVWWPENVPDIQEVLK